MSTQLTYKINKTSFNRKFSTSHEKWFYCRFNSKNVESTLNLPPYLLSKNLDPWIYQTKYFIETSHSLRHWNISYYIYIKLLGYKYVDVLVTAPTYLCTYKIRHILEWGHIPYTDLYRVEQNYQLAVPLWLNLKKYWFSKGVWRFL